MRRPRTMVRQAEAYLKSRRAMGFDLRVSGRLLLRFAEFVDRSGWHGPLTTDLILRWVHLPDAAARSYKANRLSIVRCFARYLATRDGQTEVPDWRLMPKIFHRRPHLFSQQELCQLMAATRRMRRTYPLRPLTYETFLGLLASTGLRISEALKLTRGQVDLKRGILRIEQTKFKKSRLVPLHSTTTQALRRYAAARDSRWGVLDKEPFFVGRCGWALPYETVCGAFRTLRADLGWHRGNGEWPRPRIHDLRHSFACHRLLRWYRDGENVQQKIAALATYLGHSKVTDTYWYLTGTPELMALVGSRFERFAASVKRSRS
ncbi:MAG TPA: tyrosine-type recombinase/integrase [Pirellulaceae bacterium]|nr:tyrosine-type recombinase/integrase [Pirellulaceae bacterium]